MSTAKTVNIIYFILALLTLYFSNVILGKFLLVIVLIYFLNKAFFNLNTMKKACIFFASLLILYLSKCNPLFLIAFPIGFLFLSETEGENYYKLFFLNSLLLFTIVESIYYTGINLTPLYYFWGLPILLIAFLLSKLNPAKSNVLMSFLAILIIIGQLIFNCGNYNKDIYTYSTDKSITAKYSILKEYFNKITNLEETTVNIEQARNSFNILPLSEAEFLTKKNIIVKDKNYILLAEHDNMNNYIDKYPYFNDDSFFRKAPWYLYTPNMNGTFKYLCSKDIFYSSNIGSTVNTGAPILWEYNEWGKPILLASYAKINGSNIYIFGDSDLFVDKLLPYNINLISGLLGRTLNLYPLFLLLFVITNICLLKNKKVASVIFLIAMIFAYFMPFIKSMKSNINVYSQPAYLTAHTSSYASSILNFLAKNDIAVLKSNQSKADVQVINKKQDWNKLKNSKLIYVMSNTSIDLGDHRLYCSNIKVGNEQLQCGEHIIDSRFFVIDDNVSNTGYYKKENTAFVCTGSPQLNYNLTEKMVMNEK